MNMNNKQVQTAMNVLFKRVLFYFLKSATFIRHELEHRVPRRLLKPGTEWNGTEWNAA